MGEYLRRMLAQEWRPTSRYSVAAWLVFYVVFLIYAFSQHGAFLFIDLANLVVHEGGHLLFGWFGPTLGLWGGTILQWLVPLLLAAYFFSQRQATAFAFCSFFFFENWLYTATYMADARAMLLPAGYRRRFRLHRTRLAHHLLQPGRAAVRHEDCGGRKFPGLVRHDRDGGVAGTAKPGRCCAAAR